MVSGYPPPEQLAEIAADAFGTSDLPALVLSLPSERIVAANPAAAGLLDPTGSPVIGILFQEYASDRAAPGAWRLAGCLLDGGESLRVLRRNHRAGLSIRMWVRHIEGQSAARLVLVLLVPARRNLELAGPPPTRPSVIGIVGADLTITAISSEAEQMFGVPADLLLDRPLVELLAEADRADCHAAWRDATSKCRNVAVAVSVGIPELAEERPPLECEILILALSPAPMCVFVLVPAAAARAPGPNLIRASSADLAPLLLRLGRGAELANLAMGAFSGISELELPGVELLTIREKEVVSRLADGDRVPAIAEHLYLAQSTIRNHLTSVFYKLGLGSQQELLNGLKKAREKSA